MNNLRIRTKLLISFFIVALIAAIIGIFGVVNMKTIDDADTALYETKTVPLGHVGKMATYFHRIRVNLRDAVLAETEEKSSYISRIDELSALWTEAEKEYAKTVLTDENKRLTKEFASNKKEYLSYITTFKREVEKGNDSLALVLMHGDMQKTNEKVQDLLLDLIAYNLEMAEKTAIENTALYERSRNVVITMIIIAVIIAIILGFVIATNIQNIIKSVIHQTKQLVASAVAGELTTRAKPEETNEEFREIVVGLNQTLEALINPLNVTANYIDQIAKGEMPPVITDHYNGDFNTIKNNLNLLVNSTNDVIDKAKLVANGDLTVRLKKRSENDELMIALADMVEKLAEIVAGILGGADNIADASAQMSSSAQEMSQGTSEQASSVEEVSSSIEEMNANIHQNTENAQQTEKIATKSSSDITEANKAVEITVKAMLDIAEKISIINDIAEKTDILAINAAIEAARAGEHGKGFAVVAAEVRKLAENSQVAAKEIGEVSKRSVDISKNAGDLLSKVVPDIQKTTMLVQEIAAASSEQNSGAQQIQSAVNQLNTVVQQNAASAEELSSNSEELASQAEMLKDLVSFFKLNQSLLKQAKAQTKNIQFKHQHTTNKIVNTKHAGVNFKLEDEKSDNEFMKY